MGEVKPSALCARCAVLGAATLLAGCTSNPDPVTDRDATLRLSLDEYRIEPGAIKVRSGPVRLIARNEGKLTHNVKVEEVDDEEGATPTVYGGTETMQPGEQAPGVSLRLFPGRYRLVCTIGNHENLGQYSELEVTRAGS